MVSDCARPPEMLRSPLDDVFLHATLLLTRRSAADVHAAKYLAKARERTNGVYWGHCILVVF